MLRQDIETRKFEFHLKEHQTLRNEISDSVKELRTIERYVIVGIGGVWVWLITHPGIPLAALAWWIPFVLAVAGAIRGLALTVVIKRAAEYIRLIENKIERYEGLLGWEAWIKTRRKLVICSSIAFWIVLVVTTAFVASQFGVCPFTPLQP